MSSDNVKVRHPRRALHHDLFACACVKYKMAGNGLALSFIASPSLHPLQVFNLTDNHCMRGFLAQPVRCSGIVAYQGTDPSVTSDTVRLVRTQQAVDGINPYAKHPTD